jgi:hypothetical protein
MKFKNWLQINEAGLAGRLRSSGPDISNIGQGKLGPYGTFGQVDDDPLKTTLKRGIAGVMSGIGKAVSKRVSPVDIQPTLVDPISIFKNEFIKIVTLPLQLPYINGEEVITFAKTSDRNAMIKIADQTNNGKDSRIRRINGGIIDLGLGKFDLYQEDIHGTNQEPEDQEKEDQEINSYQKAKRFTTALCKIIAYSDLEKQKDFIDLDNKYNLVYPRVVKDEIKVINQNDNTYYYLYCILEYSKKEKK